MEDEELKTTITEAVNQVVTPLLDRIEKLKGPKPSTNTDPDPDKTGISPAVKQFLGTDDKSLKGVSDAVQQWVKDKEISSLSGRQLRGLKSEDKSEQLNKIN